jgi:hypothetical protein
MNGRPFAADRQSTHDSEKRNKDLADENGEREQPLAQFPRAVQRGDDLRNAAAFRSFEEASRDPYT